MSALLEIDNLVKAFHGVPVLRGVGFEIRAGTVTGLVGGNGAGKSTLMNLLGGNLRPDSGAMRLEGRVYEPENSAAAARAGISFVHQELNLFPNLTLAENLFLTDFPIRGFFIRRSVLARQAAALLAKVGLPHTPDTPLEHLTPGERQLVEIARALHGNPKLIILDEPTTSLSPPECERLFRLVRSLQAEGCAFIFISHALGDVLQLCGRILVLRDGAVADQGPAGDFTIARLVTSMAGREIKQLFPGRTELPVADADTKPLLEVRGVRQPGVVDNIRFTLRRGEILGLSGLMGAGRTELARLLFGLAPHRSGEILLDGKTLTGGPRARIRAGLALLTESRGEDGICAGASVNDNIMLATLPAHAWGPLGLLSNARLKPVVRKVSESVHLHTRREGAEPLRRLSGGNQQKAVLARWLLAEPKVLILDEPTRGIDAAAKFEIYQLILALAAAGTGVLLISSEQEELLALSDRILVMSRGRLTGEFVRPDFSPESLLRAALAHHHSHPETHP
ncbi:MAG: monosaccharide transporter ATP-binding protein family [Verrucomicrobiales bacterium]|nr:monosaccharide transporter ATP-binding protein family [Verrucomicrobiales bacterium]